MSVAILHGEELLNTSPGCLASRHGGYSLLLQRSCKLNYVSLSACCLAVYEVAIVGYTITFAQGLHHRQVTAACYDLFYGRMSTDPLDSCSPGTSRKCWGHQMG